MFPAKDDLPNAAATARAPKAETAPNSADPETNSMLENAAEQAAPRSEHAEAGDAGQEPPVGGTPEQTGASSDSASAHDQDEATRRGHAPGAGSATPGQQRAGRARVGDMPGAD